MTEQVNTLTDTDIAAVIQIIDTAAQRGTFRGDELQFVGTVRNRFVGFLEFIKASHEANAAQDVAEEAPEEEKQVDEE